jgi:magnesium chelatase family protein
MLARIRSAAVLGIDAYLVDVEVDITNGLPSFSTVGLPQGAVKEGRERVSAALVNAGFSFPLRRITVNLAPADIRLRSADCARDSRGQRAAAGGAAARSSRHR